MDGLQAKKPEFVPCGQKLDNSRNSIMQGLGSVQIKDYIFLILEVKVTS